MKKPIHWHRECLNNQKAYLNELKRKADQAQRNYEHCLKASMFYEEQIETAEKEGKDGFDPEKYLKTRTK